MVYGKGEKTDVRELPSDAGLESPVRVKMWTGVGAIVVAVSVPGVDPDDMQCDVVRGDCLQVRGVGLNKNFCHDIQLPCPVENQPVLISEEKSDGTFYLMLKK